MRFPLLCIALGAVAACGGAVEPMPTETTVTVPPPGSASPPEILPAPPTPPTPPTPPRSEEPAMLPVAPPPGCSADPSASTQGGRFDRATVARALDCVA